MSWITPSLDDLKGKFPPQVINLIANYSAKSGDTSDALLTRELANAIEEVRGYVAANAENQLGAAGTLPASLKDCALVLARKRIYANVPGLDTLLNDAMKDEVKDVQRKLENVAAGKFRIIQPDTPGTEVIPRPKMEIVTANDRRNTRDQMKSL